MDLPRVSRNDPCPCGSGRKFKKCCYYGDRTITQLDRVLAIELIEQFVGSCDERHEARAIFCGNLDDDVPAMTKHFREASDSAFLFWFAFDYQLDDGCYVVDRILNTNQLLSDGVRRYLEQMRTTAMIPYEVLNVRPGSSVTLRRLGTQQEVEVREKTASRTLKRWDMLVARLNPLGPSGGSEMEMGVMLIPKLAQGEIAAIVSRELVQGPDGDDDLHRCKELGAVLHTIWLGTIVAPKLPTCLTAEGDPMMFVTLRFDVRDEQWLRAGLDAEPGLERDGDDTWLWHADKSRLGTIRLTGSQLTLETHSEPRADRGRRLIARIARGAAEYRSSERVDPREEVRKLIESGQWAETMSEAEAEDEIPPEIKDQLFQEYMAKHSREWLDDQIPALDQQTPRFAARSSTLKPQLLGLLKDWENDYLRALAEGEPAFDPTWMWDELELSDHPDAPRVRHPLWLAHESMEQHLPGITAAISAVVESRCAEEENLLRTVVMQDELRAAPQVQDLIRSLAGRLTTGELLAHLEFYCSYELHRRKTFWVDESLAWMLANTQVDAESSFFRLPFPGYVLVYTDRHTLSVAERALASESECPLRGQMLAVLCAYVLELAPDSSRVKVGLTFDAFAGQPPHLMTWQLNVDPSETLEKSVSDALARAKTPAAGLFRPLLDSVINTTLYTTSAVSSSISIERIGRSSRTGTSRKHVLPAIRSTICPARSRSRTCESCSRWRGVRRAVR
jgi:hypothetical protein